MEKKSLNKKLQLNKETIAILDKEQQSQILGGELPTLAITCKPPTTDDCTVLPVTENVNCHPTFDNYGTCLGGCWPATHPIMC